MASENIGIIYIVESLQIIGVINPDFDWELDDPHLDRWNGDQHTRLVKIPRGTFGQLSNDDLYNLVRSVEEQLAATSP